MVEVRLDTKYIQIYWKVEKLHRLKSQPIFSEASQTKCCEPFDFPTGISGFLHVNGNYPWPLFLSTTRSCVSFRVSLANFLSRYPPNEELYRRLNLEKTADIPPRHRWFPSETTSEKRAHKFHTYDTPLPRSGWYFWLVVPRGKLACEQTLCLGKGWKNRASLSSRFFHSFPKQRACSHAGGKFASTNQKHYPNLDSEASSVWNICARFSDVISQGNPW